MEQDKKQDLPRLQKALAAAGVASRRACETMITEGKVTVNGKIVKELGTKVDPMTDDIRVDGEPVLAPVAVKPIYIMLNKPVGYTCTVSDPNAEHTVIELVSQVEERVFPVGRLDVDSSGLLILTNDGEFANRLTHPRYHVPKVYRVRARGFVDREAAKSLIEGIDLPDGRTAPAEMMFVEYDAATQCTIIDITLFEGRNRQVRRMMEAVGNPVRELTRIRFGNLGLKGLNPGTWRKLTPAEVEDLLEQAKPTPTPPREERRTPQKPLPAPGFNVPVTPAAEKPAPRHKNDVARKPRRPLGDAARNNAGRAREQERPSGNAGAPPPRPLGRAGRPSADSQPKPPPFIPGRPAGRPAPRPAFGSQPPASPFNGGKPAGRPTPRPAFGAQPPARPFQSDRPAGRPSARPAYESQPPARPSNGGRPAGRPANGAPRPQRPSGGRPPQGRPR